jgi:hypothetical protein
VARIPSLPASQITSGTFSVGAFSGAISGTSLNVGTGNLYCGNVNTNGNGLTTGSATISCGALNSSLTGAASVSPMTLYTPSLGTGNYNLSLFGAANSVNNAGWFAFNNTGGAGAATNYAAFALNGASIGSGSFNACASGKFGVLTASPQYTLDVAGTGRYTGALISGALTCTSISTQNSSISAGSGAISGGAISGSSISASTYTGLPRKYWNASTQGVYGLAGPKYYRLGTLLAAANAANGGAIHISDAIGGFGTNQSAFMDCTIGSRGTYAVRGTAYGYVSTAKTMADLVVIMEADSSFTIYLCIVGQYVSWDLSVEGAGTNVTIYEPTDGDVTPSSNIVTASVLSVLGVVTETSTSTTSFNSYSYKRPTCCKGVQTLVPLLVVPSRVRA